MDFTKFIFIWLVVENTIAYCDTAAITTVKKIHSASPGYLLVVVIVSQFLMTSTKTLAYYATELITAVISVVIQAHPIL